MQSPLKFSGGRSSLPKKVPSSVPGLLQEASHVQRAIQTLPQAGDEQASLAGWVPWHLKGEGRQHSAFRLSYILIFWTF